MGSQKPSAATVEEARAYIAKMVEELARMAASLGDDQTAEALQQAVAGYGATPPTFQEANGF